jgi:hypothetical protein
MKTTEGRHLMSVSHRLLLAAVAATAALVAIPPALADTTYTDPPGDSGTGPDITQVVVAEAIGRVAFRVSCALVPNSEAEISLDANSDGRAYFLLDVGVEADGSRYYGVYKWNGTTYEFQKGLGEAAAVIMPNSFEISVSRLALGLSGSFAFGVDVELYAADAVVASDVAPDGTLPWTYTFASAPAPKAPAPTPPATPESRVVTKAMTAVIAKPVASPAKPVAGLPLTVTFGITRSDTGAQLTGGTTKATVSLGGTSLAARLVRTAGRTSVRVVLPKTARGKRLTVRVDVTVGGTTTTRTYSATVA